MERCLDLPGTLESRSSEISASALSIICFKTTQLRCFGVSLRKSEAAWASISCFSSGLSGSSVAGNSSAAKAEEEFYFLLDAYLKSCAANGEKLEPPDKGD
jgi:hypothetical protein